MEIGIGNELSTLTLDPRDRKQDQPGVCALEKIRVGREGRVTVSEEELRKGDGSSMKKGRLGGWESRIQIFMLMHFFPKHVTSCKARELCSW